MWVSFRIRARLRRRCVLFLGCDVFRHWSRRRILGHDTPMHDRPGRWSRNPLSPLLHACSRFPRVPRRFWNVLRTKYVVETQPQTSRIPKEYHWESDPESTPDEKLRAKGRLDGVFKQKVPCDHDRDGGGVVDINGPDKISLFALKPEITGKTLRVHREEPSKKRRPAAPRASLTQTSPNNRPNSSNVHPLSPLSRPLYHKRAARSTAVLGASPRVDAVTTDSEH